MGHNAAAKDTTKSPNNQFFAVPVLQQQKTERREDLTLGSQQGPKKMMVWKRHFRLLGLGDLGCSAVSFRSFKISTK